MAEGDFDALRAVAPAAGSEERGTRLDTAVVQTLDSSVSDLIRAAQVLPSLSIVVEELVNNALDAGASKVSVRIAWSEWSVSVVDDGHGIATADFAVLASQHASSRLHNPTSLGCRGETLWALGHLGALQVTSRSRSSEFASVKAVRFGEVKVCGRSRERCDPGTSVVVADLFGSIPVRRKVQRKRTEVSRVVQSLQRTALMRHSVCFSLVDADRSRLLVSTSAHRTVDSAWTSLFGPETLRGASHIAARCGKFACSGFAGARHGSQELQFIYVNSRPLVKASRFLRPIRAVLRGATVNVTDSGAIDVREPEDDVEFSGYPVFLLHIECDRSEYEVTFDPERTLVEFSDWGSCLRCVVTAVQQVFRAQGFPPSEESEHGGEERVSKPLSTRLGGALLRPAIRAATSGASYNTTRLSFDTWGREVARRPHCEDTSDYFDATSQTPFYVPSPPRTTHNRNRTRKLVRRSVEGDISPAKYRRTDDTPAEHRNAPTHSATEVREATQAASQDLSPAVPPVETATCGCCHPDFRSSQETGAEGVNDIFSKWQTERGNAAQGRSLPSVSFQSRSTPRLSGTVRTAARAARVPLATASEAAASLGVSVTKDALREMTIDRKFVLARAGNILYCIDQHAADERVNLERMELETLGADGSARNFRSCVLGKPILLPTTPRERSVAASHADVLESWGFSITVDPAQLAARLVRVPMLLGVQLSAKDAVEYLAKLADVQHSAVLMRSLRPPAVTRVLQSKACRGAIMFNQQLSLPECRDLLSKLARCRLPFQCAHGRPSMMPLLDLGKDVPGTSSVRAPRRTRMPLHIRLSGRDPATASPASE